MTGDVTVICGPTAVGKGTIVRAVAAAHPEVWVSVSATTRAPRPTEVDGVDYLFVTEAEFDELVGTDGLLHRHRGYDEKLTDARELAKKDPRAVANIIKEWTGANAS